MLLRRLRTCSVYSVRSTCFSLRRPIRTANYAPCAQTAPHVSPPDRGNDDKREMLRDLIAIMGENRGSSPDRQRIALAAIVFCVNHGLITLKPSQLSEDNVECVMEHDDENVVFTFLETHKFDRISMQFIVSELRAMRARLG